MKNPLGSSWTLLVLIAVPCILLWPVLAGKCLVPADLLADIAPWRTGNPADLVPWNPLRFDGITQFYPWRWFYAQTFHSGYIPLWNPHQFSGTPFLANSQSAVMYPLNVVFLMMPVAKAFGVSAILHLFLTGKFLYLYMRHALKVSRRGAIVAAVIWQLSMWQVAWLALPSFLDTSAWFPLTLLIAHGLARTPTIGRAAALGGVLGLSLLAGHLQIGLYGVLMTLAYAIYRSIAERTQLRGVVTCALIVALTLFLTAAPQLLPVLELSHQSHRAALGPPTMASFTGYNALAMPVFNLVTLLVPGFFGHPGVTGDHPGVSEYWGVTNYAENACYIGIAGLLLAIAGLIALCSRARPAEITPARFFAWAAGISLLLALGTWLGGLLYFGLPGFGQTGSPARVLCIFTLSAAVLAGVGFDALLSRAVSAWVAIGAYLGGAAVIFAVSLGMLNAKLPGILGSLSSESNDFRLMAGLMLASIAVLALYMRKTLTNSQASAALIVLVAADLLGAGMGYNPEVKQSTIYPVTPAIAFLQRSVKPGDRIMAINRDWSITRPPNAILPPNGATVFGLDDIAGYDSLQTGAYKAYANQADGQESSPPENGNITFFDKPFTLQTEQLGARWIVSQVLIAGHTPAYSDGSCAIYEDPHAGPQFPVEYRGFDGNGPAATVAVRAKSPTDLTIELRGSGGLSMALPEYPGWQVKVAGKSGPAFNIRDYVYLSAPSSTELFYRPVSFRLGLYLGMVAIALYCGLAALRAASPHRRRQREERRPV